GNEISHVLWRNQIQQFDAGGNAVFGQLQQQLPGQADTLVDLERVIQIRVVDQLLPADGRAWFFEIHAHDDDQFLVETFARTFQQLGIFLRRLDVVNGAGADDNQHAVVLAFENVGNGAACVINSG